MKNRIIENIVKSSLAAIFISFGVAVKFATNNWVGAVLFAFGLFCVCNLNANLFTGKMGYAYKDKNKMFDLIITLIVNGIVGYLCGLAISYMNPNFVEAAVTIVNAWSFSINHFIGSIFCGAVMYCCIELYKRKQPIGIFFGIPLFILSGFQHSIANFITMGVSRSFSPVIFLCIIGNFIGGVLLDMLVNYKTKKEES